MSSTRKTTRERNMDLNSKSEKSLERDLETDRTASPPKAKAITRNAPEIDFALELCRGGLCWRESKNRVIVGDDSWLRPLCRRRGMSPASRPWLWSWWASMSKPGMRNASLLPSTFPRWGGVFCKNFFKSIFLFFSTLTRRIIYGGLSIWAPLRSSTCRREVLIIYVSR